MRVYVEQFGTRLFLTRDKRWVSGSEQAHAFPSATAANEFCLHHNIRGVRLFVTFENPAHNTYIDPFGNETASPRPATPRPSR